MMNAVQLLGRLTHEPELRYTPAGIPWSLFRCRGHTQQGQGEQGRLFQDRGMAERAEFVARHLTKGRQIAVTGRLSTRKREKDGVKWTEVEIVASGIYFADSGGQQPQPDDQNAQPFSADDIPF
jgi:single-strand DNA-binding protein